MTIPGDCVETDSLAARRAATLRGLCVQRGIALVELARRARISRATLHYFTSGATTRPHARTLARIAEVLSVDPRILDEGSHTSDEHD